MSGPRFRPRGATVGIPSGIPIIGERKPVARMQVIMYSDGTSDMAIPGNPDLAAAMLWRLVTAMLSDGLRVEATAPPAPEPQGDGDMGVNDVNKIEGL